MDGNGPIYLDLSLATQEERDFLALRSPDIVSPSLKSKTTSIWTVPARKAGIDIFREKLEAIPMFVGGQGPIAVDDEHGLLLTASVVTGYVEITELETGKKLARHYVGKFGRILRVERKGSPCLSGSDAG